MSVTHPRYYKEVSLGLFVGNAEAWDELRDKRGWAYIHAAKEPWHRKLLGYTRKGCPPDHLEYLIAVRDNELFMNFVDAQDMAFIPYEMIQTALLFIDQKLLGEHRQVLIHCNAGMSRSPSLALLWMAINEQLPTKSYHLAAEYFTNHVYPLYEPRQGIAEHCCFFWDEYLTETKALMEERFV